MQRNAWQPTLFNVKRRQIQVTEIFNICNGYINRFMRTRLWDVTYLIIVDTCIHFGIGDVL